MANEKQLSILRQGVEVWNRWRGENPGVQIILLNADLSDASLRDVNLSGADLRLASLLGADLRGADLRKAYFREADFRGADLACADLHAANLRKADLRDANLSQAGVSKADLRFANLLGARLEKADLSRANLSQVNLKHADLHEAELWDANLRGADLSLANLSGARLGKADLSYAILTGANLSGSNLNGTQLVGTEVSEARISGSSVYGISVWDLKGEFEDQKDLIITRDDQPVVTLDNIEVAQFFYLVLNNEKIRDVINTLTSKSVLILGRFSLPERKGVLNALRNKLREYNLLPIVFDFDRSTDRDFTETIKTLAGLSYFVIADVTNPKSSPLELQATVPDYQIPFVPIIQEGEQPFAMMVDLQKKYNWVLKTRTYRSKEALIGKLKEGIIDPAMEKHNELRLMKAQKPDTVSLG